MLSLWIKIVLCLTSGGRICQGPRSWGLECRAGEPQCERLGSRGMASLRFRAIASCQACTAGPLLPTPHFSRKCPRVCASLSEATAYLHPARM